MKHFIVRINKSDGFKTEWLAGAKSILRGWEWTTLQIETMKLTYLAAGAIHVQLKQEGITTFILSESPPAKCHKNLRVTPQQCFENYERQHLA